MTSAKKKKKKDCFYGGTRSVKREYWEAKKEDEDYFALIANSIC